MGKLLTTVRATQGKKLRDRRDEAELAVAWAFHEVSLKEISDQLGKKGNQLYSMLSRSLRDAADMGMIERL